MIVIVMVSGLCFRWQCPRTPWTVRAQGRWAGLNMVEAVSSSSWEGWAYCPVYTDSSPDADEL